MSGDITRTEHGDIVAMTAVHDRVFDRRLGGVRFVQHGTEEEVRHLAAGMAEKCAASRVPVGGQKTLIVCPGGVPYDAGRRADILAEHIAHVVGEDDGGIFGPDMSCGVDVLDRVAMMPIVGDHVTGLSEALGGLDINRRAFTARGVLHAFDCLTRLDDPRVSSASVQGFGMVGAPIALGLAERGLAVRAVSNRYGALIDENGLDIAWLFAWWNELGDECFAKYASSIAGARFARDPNALFDARADMFVPAARTTVLSLADELPVSCAENPHVTAVEAFAARSECKVVLEAANHPLTAGAEECLERRGVRVLPDILVNIGGMVGCYAEWRHRERVRNGDLSLDDLAEHCHAYTSAIIEKNVREVIAASSSVRCTAASIVMQNRGRALERASAQEPLALV